jgi:hypothetical protein
MWVCVPYSPFHLPRWRLQASRFSLRQIHVFIGGVYRRRWAAFCSDTQLVEIPSSESPQAVAEELQDWLCRTAGGPWTFEQEDVR